MKLNEIFSVPSFKIILIKNSGRMKVIFKLETFNLQPETESDARVVEWQTRQT
jgi:hypothetical protein